VHTAEPRAAAAIQVQFDRGFGRAAAVRAVVALVPVMRVRWQLYQC
jgi:hypothetical protein